MADNATLLISCPDQRGITAAVTNFVFHNNGNILHADQHIDSQTNTFFMRIEWALDDFKIKTGEIGKAFEDISAKFQMSWDLSFSAKTQKMAVFVSKHLHCLQDLLLRKEGGQLNCTFPVIISNHADAKQLAEAYGIGFAEIPKTAENKPQQESKELELLTSHDIDGIILARYHQVLTPYFIEHYRNKIINIHHSFLPAFPGKNPYKQAYQKGVKIIGATSHYVTETLDDGPIIGQDTARISHRDNIEDLIRKGEDLEKQVLFRAVKYHLERKVLVYGNKTVIFD